MRTKLKYFLLYLICFSSLTSCGQRKTKTDRADSLRQERDQTVAGNFSDQSKIVFDSLKIDVFFKKFALLRPYEQQVKIFYRKRNFAYAWFEQGRLIEHANNLANRMLNLESDGLYKAVPYQTALDALINESDGGDRKKAPSITLELILTAQYFLFAKVAWQGMNDSVSQSEKWFLPRKRADYDSYLDSLLKSPAISPPSNEPVYRQYELLRAYLRKYRSIEAKKKWLSIAIPKIMPLPGDTVVSVIQVKKLLALLGDFQGDTLNPIYDPELSTALRRFQQRHGLEVTGTLDKTTYQQLNIPLKSRIKQILVNMERSRWLPIVADDDYLAVNIPEFKLHVYHADSLLWSCKVVVGKTVYPTTVFSGKVQYIVFSPYWNVPQSIVRKEIVPGMKKESDYLNTHDMEITGYQDGLPKVRQKPGPMNSLGLVKFMFPNTYDIYLHDTPSKSFFDQSSRAFSHGCIRVMEPLKLANFLLDKDARWDSVKVVQAMHAGKERYVTLNRKVPVYIAYFTAFIDREGLLNFRKDIYNLDSPLAAMILAGKGPY